jgi:general secretion pathway protein I
VERVELPPMPESSDLDADAGAADDTAGLGALGGLASLSAPGATMGDNPTPASLFEQVAPSGGAGIESMVMGLVYPSLKPMLEASIRRVTVKVTWREGSRKRELEATQFLTRPEDGALATADQVGLGAAAAGGALLPPGATPASAATPTTPTTPTTPGRVR